MKMFNYNDIIEYIDCTIDENFENARKWCSQNNAKFEELINKRVVKDGVLYRYFQIKEIKFIKEKSIELPKQPEPTIEEQNETIRQARQIAYTNTSDILFMEYQEAVARKEVDAEEKKQLWLASKDKIREDNPYITK